MKKNNTMAKVYLGEREKEVISRLSYEKVSVITKKEFKGFFDFSIPVLNKILFKLKKCGILKNIKKEIYLYCPLEQGMDGININEFLLPYILFPKGKLCSCVTSELFFCLISLISV